MTALPNDEVEKYNPDNEYDYEKKFVPFDILITQIFRHADVESPSVSQHRCAIATVQCCGIVDYMNYCCCDINNVSLSFFAMPIFTEAQCSNIAYAHI